MNEMQSMIHIPAFDKAWLEHARDYRNYSNFRIGRLAAYAAWQLYDPKLASEAWDALWKRNREMKIDRILPPEVPSPLDECERISTNEAALWSLDAIFMQEVIPQ